MTNVQRLEKKKMGVAAVVVLNFSNEVSLLNERDTNLQQKKRIFFFVRIFDCRSLFDSSRLRLI